MTKFINILGIVLGLALGLIMFYTMGKYFDENDGRARGSGIDTPDRVKKHLLEQIGQITEDSPNYVVVTYSDINKLEFVVAEYLKHGYITLGGVAVNSSGCFLYQALYRPSK